MLNSNTLYLLSWLLVGLSFIIYIVLKIAFTKYDKQPNSLGLTGKGLIELLNNQTGYGVVVKMAKGWASDYYNPLKNEIVLSPNVYNNASITAIGIAAHEYGHAIQKNSKYPLMFLRNFLTYYANIGTTLGFWIAFIGIVLGATGLITFGLFLYAGVVAFTLITLPVEFDASRRAIKVLRNLELTGDELRQVKIILSLAGFTYVLAFVSSLVDFLYLVSLAKDRD